MYSSCAAQLCEMLWGHRSAHKRSQLHTYHSFILSRHSAANMIRTTTAFEDNKNIRPEDSNGSLPKHWIIFNIRCGTSPKTEAIHWTTDAKTEEHESIRYVGKKKEYKPKYRYLCHRLFRRNEIEELRHPYQVPASSPNWPLTMWHSAELKAKLLLLGFRKRM
jgi:hypothetical protein